MADRRYDENEVSQILRIAGDMQAGLAATGSPQGVSLSELQKVAEEVGIDPELIAKAAQEFDLTPAKTPRFLPASVWVDRGLEGEISDETWDEMITEVRRFVGSPGRSEAKSNSREWIGGWKPGSVMLSVASWRGRTRLKLLGDTTDFTSLQLTIGAAFFVILPLMPLIYRKSHPDLSPLLTFVLSIGIAAIAALGTWGFIQSHRKRLGAQIRALLGRLADIAGQGQSEAENDMRRALQNEVSPQIEVNPVVQGHLKE